MASAELFQSAVKPCTSGTPGCGWRDGDVVSFFRFSWADTTTTTATGLLHSNFDFVYPTGQFVVGLGGNTLEFTDQDPLIHFLRTLGTASSVTGHFVNPAPNDSGTGGSFGGEVPALKLNVDFADADLTLGNTGLYFGDLTMCGFVALPDLNGLKVRDYLGVVNTALGGGATADSITDLDAVTRDLNLSFSFGYALPFAQEHLVNGPCP